jgi:hypothetical protein
MWGIATTSAGTLGEQHLGPRRACPGQLVPAARTAHRPALQGGARELAQARERALPDQLLTRKSPVWLAYPKRGGWWRIGGGEAQWSAGKTAMIGDDLRHSGSIPSASRWRMARR